MGTRNYSDDFKRDSVYQITGYPVREVSKRVGVIMLFSVQMDAAVRRTSFEKGQRGP